MYHDKLLALEHKREDVGLAPGSDGLLVLERDPDVLHVDVHQVALAEVLGWSVEVVGLTEIFMTLSKTSE